MLTTRQISSGYTWVNVIEPTSSELKSLVDDYGATIEILGYAVDRNERARVETDLDKNIFLIIFDALTNNFDNNGQTEPISFLTIGNVIITFTHNSTSYMQEIFENNINHIKENDLITHQIFDAILETLYTLTNMYLDAITQINFQRQSIQNQFKNRLNRTGIDSMLQLETSIIYLLTSAKANTSLLLSMNRMQNVQMDTEQHERLEDVIVESQQAQEMAELCSDIIDRVSSSYSNVLDNNLNHTMKFLTVFSIVLAVPNIVFGFYGQNVPLPFGKASWGWEFTILLSFGLIGIVYLIANWSDFFKK
ncbi:magnesium transporter CorA family protein [Pediococcus argentinicus]|uniref:magnesium transporter CorA family protein n=1 Tax=Pediococcus argentinicus TaxID=480391 RepID=UPI0033900597